MKKYDKDTANKYAVIIRDDLLNGCKSSWEKHPSEYTYIYGFVTEKVRKSNRINPIDEDLYVRFLDKALKNFNPEKASFFTYLCNVVTKRKQKESKKRADQEITERPDKDGNRETRNIIEDAADCSVNVEDTALANSDHNRILKLTAGYINYIKSLHSKNAERKSIQLEKEWYPLFFTDILYYVGNYEESGKRLFGYYQADFEKAWESCFASHFLENECLSIFDVLGNDYKHLSFFTGKETDSDKRCGGYEKMQKSSKNDNVSFTCLDKRVYTSYHLKTTNNSVSTTTVGNNMDNFNDLIRGLYSGEKKISKPTDE